MRSSLLAHLACPACLEPLFCFTHSKVPVGSGANPILCVGLAPHVSERNELTSLLGRLAAEPTQQGGNEGIEVESGLLICGWWTLVSNYKRGIPELLPDHLRDDVRELEVLNIVTADAPVELTNLLRLWLEVQPIQTLEPLTRKPRSISEAKLTNRFSSFLVRLRPLHPGICTFRFISLSCSESAHPSSICSAARSSLTAVADMHGPPSGCSDQGSIRIGVTSAERASRSPLIQWARPSRILWSPMLRISLSSRKSPEPFSWCTQKFPSRSRLTPGDVTIRARAAGWRKSYPRRARSSARGGPGCARRNEEIRHPRKGHGALGREGLR